MLPTEPRQRVRAENSCAAASAECRSQCHIDVVSLSRVFVTHSLTALQPWPLILQPAGYNAVCTTLISTFPRDDENHSAEGGRGSSVSTSSSCRNLVCEFCACCCQLNRLKCRIFGTLPDISRLWKLAQPPDSSAYSDQHMDVCIGTG